MNCIYMVGLIQLVDILLVNENMAELVFYKLLYSTGNAGASAGS